MLKMTIKRKAKLIKEKKERLFQMQENARMNGQLYSNSIRTCEKLQKEIEQLEQSGRDEKETKIPVS